jgi:hypothetical protein
VLCFTLSVRHLRQADLDRRRFVRLARPCRTPRNHTNEAGVHRTRDCSLDQLPGKRHNPALRGYRLVDRVDRRFAIGPSIRHPWEEFMRFYEVHDEDGCLIKTKDLRTAKKSALAYLTMKAGRELRIDRYSFNSMTPTARTRLDPTSRTWSAPEPVSRRARREPVVARHEVSAAAG